MLSSQGNFRANARVLFSLSITEGLCPWTVPFKSVTTNISGLKCLSEKLKASEVCRTWRNKIFFKIFIVLLITSANGGNSVGSSIRVDVDLKRRSAIWKKQELLVRSVDGYFRSTLPARKEYLAGDIHGNALLTPFKEVWIKSGAESLISCTLTTVWLSIKSESQEHYLKIGVNCKTVVTNGERQASSPFETDDVVNASNVNSLSFHVWWNLWKPVIICFRKTLIGW